MFSRPRRTVGPRDPRPEKEAEAHDDWGGVPCRVRVITRGLALMLALMLVGLASQSRSPSLVPAAIATYDGFSSCVRALVLSADDRTIYGCNADGTHTIWDTRLSRARVCASQGPYIVRALFAHDGSKLAVVDTGGVVSLWELAQWRRLAEIPARGGMAKPLAFSRDCTTLATADDFGVRLWDVTTATPSEGPELDLDGVTSLAFASDGRTLAVGTVDGTVRLWDSAQGRQFPRFRAHGSEVISLAFAEADRMLASCSHNERMVRLWDVDAGRLLKEFDGRSAIQAFAFAPGSRELATAGFDGAVRLWDVATGDSRWDLSAGDGPVTALDFSADGATLACGSIGAIRMYRLDVAPPSGD